MLTAYEVNSQQCITLIQKSIGEINQYKKRQFFCPVCKQPVTLKAGAIKIPHFAHRPTQNCQYESEAETREHLELKQMFAAWCHQEQLPVQVEPYLAKLKQRPDLLIGHLALEIQCSPLALKRLQERTAAYRKHGYQVIWICGKNLCTFQQLTELAHQMSYYSKQLGFYLWQADWQQKELTLLFHLEETQTKHLFFSRKSWTFQQSGLLQILNYPQVGQLFVRRSHSLSRLLQAYFSQLTGQFTYKQKQLSRLQNHFYQQQYHLLHLPQWFYYPGIRLYPIKQTDLTIKLLVWQALKRLPIAVYPKEKLFLVIKMAVAQGTVYFRNYPNIDSEVLIEHCAQKLFLWLVECQVIQKSDENYQITLNEKEERKEYLKNQYKRYKNLALISVTPTKI